MNNFFDALLSSKRMAVITGAGASTDSGIPDFQSLDEKWPFKYPRQIMISRQFMYEKPHEFWRAYKYIFHGKFSENLKPNSFHKFLSLLEKRAQVKIITQNVDGLHQAAGSSEVFEVHGSLNRYSCSWKKCSYEIEDLNLVKSDEAPPCPECGHFLRPNVVLFGEKPKFLKETRSVLAYTDLLLVTGTSLNVAPVNTLPMELHAMRPEVPQLWLNRVDAPAGYFFRENAVGELKFFLEEYKTALSKITI